MPSKPTKKPKRSATAKRLSSRSAPPSASLRPVYEQRLKELAEFKRKHGHCNVPQVYAPNLPLGHWVAYTRQQKRRGALDPALVRRLAKLGFTWRLTARTARRLDWDKMVAALRAFKGKHGHFRVPAKHKPLAEWTAGVRRKRRKGLLDHRRIRQLDQLGFVWEPLEHVWERGFLALARFHGKYGHCMPEDPRLATWVRSQCYRRQRNTLKAQYIERLDEIGFAWDWAGSVRANRWESMVAALVEFRRIHGHCRVSTLDKDHASLGNWVRTQRTWRRQGKLSAERIRKLDELGFVWEAPSGRHPRRRD